MDQPRTAPYPNNIRACRISAGLSHEELADRTGLSLARILRLEEHGKRPLQHVLDKLSLALDCTPEELLRGDMRPGVGAGLWAAKGSAQRRTLSLDEQARLEDTCPRELERLRALDEIAQNASGQLPRYPNKLALLRRLSGLSQEALGQGAGMSKVKISRLENGKIRLLPSDARALAKVLGCGETDFHYRQAPPEPDD